jgi:glycerol kinase
VRACLEGVANSVADVVSCLPFSSSSSSSPLLVDGGLAASRVLLQMVADCSGRAVMLAQDTEATARVCCFCFCFCCFHLLSRVLRLLLELGRDGGSWSERAKMEREERVLDQRQASKNERRTGSCGTNTSRKQCHKNNRFF